METSPEQNAGICELGVFCHEAWKGTTYQCINLPDKGYLCIIIADDIFHISVGQGAHRWGRVWRFGQRVPAVVRKYSHICVALWWDVQLFLFTSQLFAGSFSWWWYICVIGFVSGRPKNPGCFRLSLFSSLYRVCISRLPSFTWSHVDLISSRSDT